MPRTKAPTASFTIERFTLPNGLRVVLSPDRSSPTVCVAVYYDVGFRSEPEGRTGFAHLFEHLMFEGSTNLEKMQHAHLVQGNGGTMNGSTNLDYTNYFEQLPSNALELGLFLEADRMRSIRLSDETLHNQIDVVKEEIRVNVLNRPYGGIPFIHLPPVMFQKFNNTHNGYGSFVDLESATTKDAAEFFKRFYAPSNAVLTVAGDLDVGKTTKMIERLFGDIPKRSAPRRPDFSESLPDGERRSVHPDAMAQIPMLAAGYRVPDPIKRPHDYMAAMVAGDVLADGEASRLYQRLVKQDQIVSHVFGLMGAFGTWWEHRDPIMFQLMAFHMAPSCDIVLQAIDEEVAKVASGIEQAELERVLNVNIGGYLRRVDNLIQRTLTLAVLEQQRGRAELLNEIPALLAEITTDDVARVAGEWFVPDRRAVLDVQPAQAAGGAAA